MPVVWEIDMTKRQIEVAVLDLGLWVILFGDMIEDMQDDIKKMRKRKKGKVRK
jgi:hypothetical protein